jgi:polyketide cyclase/dehydrase/lipid transport protein
MGKHVIDARAHSQAPPDVVWQVLADGRGWAQWGPWQKAELEREGSPPPDGLGAIRRLIRRPVTTREEVTVFEPPSRFGYEMLSGLPFRGYRAEVTLSEAEGGTDIRWRSEFDAKIPGTGSLFRRQLGGFIADVVKRVAREAERRTA